MNIRTKTLLTLGCLCMLGGYLAAMCPGCGRPSGPHHHGPHGPHHHHPGPHGPHWRHHHGEPHEWHHPGPHGWERSPERGVPMLPTDVRAWLIRNETNEPINIQSSKGGTNVTLPAGESMTLARPAESPFFHVISQRDTKTFAPNANVIYIKKTPEGTLLYTEKEAVRETAEQEAFRAHPFLEEVEHE